MMTGIDDFFRTSARISVKMETESMVSCSRSWIQDEEYV
jgi:hypothetical protein